MNSPCQNDQRTRRRFLAHSLQGLAVAGLPQIAMRTASAQQEAANDRLHVAAIGVGGRGTEIGHQAGALAQMVAVADVDLDAADRFAAKYEGRCKVVEDYRRVLDRPDVDAVICGTPDHWHTRISIDAMRAGKDVYCEKPLTLTMEESRQIARAATETGRVFQVGTQQRTEFNQCFLQAIAIARSGRLGHPLKATSSVGEATSGGPFPVATIPARLNFDLWLGQAPRVEFCQERVGWNFRWWLAYSGGQVTDWGVHHTDIAMWALGGEETGAVEVEGRGDYPGLPYTTSVIDFLNGRVPLPPQYNVAQTFRCDLRLPNGNSVELTSGKNELLIEGPEGKIRVNRNGISGKSIEEISADPEQQAWLTEQVDQLYRGMPITSHMGNFMHCIKTREKPISDVWSHCHSVNACHMANIAMLTKQKLKFDLEAYCFNDRMANELMQRHQRRPWRTSV